ncbi:hypothetical protein ACJX0J_034430, partial [Zea mays]
MRNFASQEHNIHGDRKWEKKILYDSHFISISKSEHIFAFFTGGLFFGQKLAEYNAEYLKLNSSTSAGIVLNSGHLTISLLLFSVLYANMKYLPVYIHMYFTVQYECEEEEEENNLQDVRAHNLVNWKSRESIMQISSTLSL